MGHGPVRRVDGFRSPGGGSVVTTLIGLNIAIFVVCWMTGSRHGVPGSPLFTFGAMSSSHVLHGEIWRLVTANYLHWDGFHILVNMVGLHFLGRALESDWGPKKFLWVYNIAGLLGSLFYLLLGVAGWLPTSDVAAGASGCVLGMLGACAVRYPRAEVYIYFLFPLRIRTAALIFAGLYAFNLFQRGPNAGGDAAHLAGLAFGVWWALQGDTWWSRRSGVRSAGRARSQAPSGGFAEKVQSRRDDEETIDRILKKVYDGGIHSLTDGERRSLQEATERRREREARAGRVDRL